MTKLTRYQAECIVRDALRALEADPSLDADKATALAMHAAGHDTEDHKAAMAVNQAWARLEGK